MVMRTSFKVLIRLFKKHISRFFTIIAIAVVSIGFMSGIMEIENKVNSALNQFYENQNVSDLFIKSKKATGFSEEELSFISFHFAEEQQMKSFSYDSYIEEEIVRIYYFDSYPNKINQLELQEGNWPQNTQEIVVERKTNTMKGYHIGDIVSYQNQEYQVSGIVINPLIIHQDEETSYIDSESSLDAVWYFYTPHLPIVNDLYLTFSNRTLFHAFSKEYKMEIQANQEWITHTLGEENIEVLSLYENFGLYSLSLYANKVSIIGSITVVFFSLITLLVVYSTMTRLLDEERAQIACLKTLGYGRLKIINQYLWFVGLAIGIGGIIAFGVGIGFTSIIYHAFNIQYVMPPMPVHIRPFSYIFLFFFVFIITFVLTWISSFKQVNQKPVTLLTPKAPKKGKKVLLERIPFIWNRFSFKYKSTIRNVLLFKSRFFMTVLSIIGSTVLVLSGFGILDCSLAKDSGASSLIIIAVALISFSAVLCALVIYNLTNINVSERTREIATLMVLGYKDVEVTGYIFREIYIMSFIGAILGVPAGYGFLHFVFYLIDFGTIAEINWYTWIIAPGLTMLFSLLSTALLYKKIVKTDMNGSLKMLE